jgi:hypothetical protein
MSAADFSGKLPSLTHRKKLSLRRDPNLLQQKC